MNSLTVMSLWDHSSSVYLEPTSTGTVRQPAISWIYSKLLEKYASSFHQYCQCLLGNVIDLEIFSKLLNLAESLLTTAKWR